MRERPGKSKKSSVSIGSTTELFGGATCQVLVAQGDTIQSCCEYVPEGGGGGGGGSLLEGVYDEAASAAAFRQALAHWRAGGGAGDDGGLTTVDKQESTVAARGEF